MLATFTPMPKPLDDDEIALKKINVTGKVDPRLKDPLDAFGKRLRALGVYQHGSGGVSNAIEAVLEMADYLGWFEDPSGFAIELMRHRAEGLSGRKSKK